MAQEIVFRDNSEEVLKELKTKMQLALFKIGASCQGYAQDNTPRRTGALASSWTVQVRESEQCVYIGVPKDYEMNGQKPADYAIYVENGSRNNTPVHMLKRAATEHSDEYKKIAENIMKSG